MVRRKTGLKKKSIRKTFILKKKLEKRGTRKTRNLKKKCIGGNNILNDAERDINDKLTKISEIDDDTNYNQEIQKITNQITLNSNKNEPIIEMLKFIINIYIENISSYEKLIPNNKNYETIINNKIKKCTSRIKQLETILQQKPAINLNPVSPIVQSKQNPQPKKDELPRFFQPKPEEKEPIFG
jgi:hypothetical protein